MQHDRDADIRADILSAAAAATAAATARRSCITSGVMQNIDGDGAASAAHRSGSDEEIHRNTLLAFKHTMSLFLTRYALRIMISLTTYTAFTHLTKISDSLSVFYVVCQLNECIGLQQETSNYNNIKHC
jgi:hypothetical protein